MFFPIPYDDADKHHDANSQTKRRLQSEEYQRQSARHGRSLPANLSNNSFTNGQRWGADVTLCLNNIDGDDANDVDSHSNSTAWSWLKKKVFKKRKKSHQSSGSGIPDAEGVLQHSPGLTKNQSVPSSLEDYQLRPARAMSNAVNTTSQIANILRCVNSQTGARVASSMPNTTTLEIPDSQQHDSVTFPSPNTDDEGISSGSLLPYQSRSTRIRQPAMALRNDNRVVAVQSIGVHDLDAKIPSDYKELPCASSPANNIDNCDVADEDAGGDDASLSPASSHASLDHSFDNELTLTERPLGTSSSTNTTSNCRSTQLPHSRHGSSGRAIYGRDIIKQGRHKSATLRK